MLAWCHCLLFPPGCLFTAPRVVGNEYLSQECVWGETSSSSPHGDLHDMMNINLSVSKQTLYFLRSQQPWRFLSLLGESVWSIHPLGGAALASNAVCRLILKRFYCRRFGALAWWGATLEERTWYWKVAGSIPQDWQEKCVSESTGLPSPAASTGEVTWALHLNTTRAGRRCRGGGKNF